MDVTQQRRLAIIIDLFVKTMPRRRYTRLILTDMMLGFEPGTITSSNDLSDDQITTLLDDYFPEWREQFIIPDDHPEIFQLAQRAHALVDDVYPHPPEPTPEERAQAKQAQRAKYEAYKERRRAKKHEAYLEREAKRQAKKRQQKQANHLSIPEGHEPSMNEDRLKKLNAWRAKAGLPPVTEL